MAPKATEAPTLELVLKRNSVERLKREKSPLGMLDELPALIAAGYEQVDPLRAAHREDLEAAPAQRLQRLAPDEAARAGDEHALHASRWACDASRGDIVRPSGGGAGHSMAKAGSSQRRPRAAAATCGVDIA